MADYGISPADVEPASVGGRLTCSDSGNITAGKAICNIGNEAHVADNSTLEATAKVVGISVAGVVYSGQPVPYQTTGILTVGGTEATIFSTVGEMICLSSSGGLCPYSDLAAGDYLTIIGYAINGYQIQLAIYATGLQIATIS